MQPVEQRQLPVVRQFIPLLVLEHSLLILVLLPLTTLWLLVEVLAHLMVEPHKEMVVVVLVH
jgi:hypothetical protein